MPTACPVFSKTHLDWIVSGSLDKHTCSHQCFPSPDGGGKAHACFVQTLTVMMAEIVEEAMLLIPAVSAKAE